MICSWLLWFQGKLQCIIDDEECKRWMIRDSHYQCPAVVPSMTWKMFLEWCPERWIGFFRVELPGANTDVVGFDKWLLNCSIASIHIYRTYKAPNLRLVVLTCQFWVTVRPSESCKTHNVNWKLIRYKKIMLHLILDQWNKKKLSLGVFTRCLNVSWLLITLMSQNCREFCRLKYCHPHFARTVVLVSLISQNWATLRVI